MKCVICGTELFGAKKRYCSNKCKQKSHYYKIKKQTNTYHSQTIRALKRKFFLIEKRGGKCEVCGYAKNISALEFHHIDSNTKESKLDARVLSNRNFDFILNEFEKCMLLCTNCHKELHNPELSLENVKRILQGAFIEESIE